MSCSAIREGWRSLRRLPMSCSLRFRCGERELSFFSISATVGTATDVTVDELAIESFYPAEEDTAAYLRSAH